MCFVCAGVDVIYRGYSVVLGLPGCSCLAFSTTDRAYQGCWHFSPFYFSQITYSTFVWQTQNICHVLMHFLCKCNVMSSKNQCCMVPHILYVLLMTRIRAGNELWNTLYVSVCYEDRQEVRNIKKCRCFHTGHEGSLNDLMAMIMMWIICYGLLSHKISNQKRTYGRC